MLTWQMESQLKVEVEYEREAPLKAKFLTIIQYDG